MERTGDPALPGGTDATGSVAAGQRVMPATAAWFLGLVAWTTLLAFYDLDGGAGFEPTDCWVAQTAREMRAGKTWEDLVVPRFCGEKRMQKSPGAYWAVVLTSYLRGTPVDEAATRIPNGIAAILLVVTVFWLTRQIGGDRAAVFAGFATSASVLVLYWSHRGASDLGLATLVAISLACAWLAARSPSRGWRQNVLWLTAYFAAGLGMLYKMPMPLVCVGLPAFGYVLLRNRWRVLADPIHLLGFGLFLLSWLPWAIAVVIAEPTALAKWRVEYLDRFTGALPNVAGQQTDWRLYLLYLGVPFVFCAPFSLSLPQAVARGFRRDADVDRDGTLFLLIWFFSLLAFFTASAGKELRYLLPALPPLFVLLGIELANFFDPRRRRASWAVKFGTWAVWILVPLGLVGGVFALRYWFQQRGQYEGLEWRQAWVPYVVCAAIFCAGTAAAAWLYRRRRTNASFATLVGTMWATWLWTWPTVFPVLVSQAPFRDFAAQLREKVPPSEVQHIRQIAQQDARIIWYSDYRFPRVVDQLELLAEQGYRRNLQYEYRRVGQEIIDQLAGERRALFVAGLKDYFAFRTLAPRELAKEGRPMPPTHLWLQTHLGRHDLHFVLFGNQPPPWPEPELAVPGKLKEKLLAAAAVALPATTRPAGGG